MNKIYGVLLLLSTNFFCAMDNQIPLDGWNHLKDAVFTKKGASYQLLFNREHDEPSKAGVRELAQHLDNVDDLRRGGIWDNCYPGYLQIYVNDKLYDIERGIITKIIIDYWQGKNY